MQRDHYLPLKVIRAHLDAVDAGETAALPGAERATVQATANRFSRDDSIHEAGRPPAARRGDRRVGDPAGRGLRRRGARRAARSLRPHGRHRAPAPPRRARRGRARGGADRPGHRPERRPDLAGRARSAERALESSPTTSRSCTRASCSARSTVRRADLAAGPRHAVTFGPMSSTRVPAVVAGTRAVEAPTRGEGRSMPARSERTHALRPRTALHGRASGARRRGGYRGAVAARAAGISYRQLDYWARTELVEPTVRGAAGSGSQRLYGFRDILA